MGFFFGKQEVSFFFFAHRRALCVCVAARRTQEMMAIVRLVIFLAVLSDAEACFRALLLQPPPPPPPAPGVPPLPPPPPPIHKVVRQRERMMTRNNCKQVQVRSSARGGRARGAVFVLVLTFVCSRFLTFVCLPVALRVLARACSFSHVALFFLLACCVRSRWRNTDSGADPGVALERPEHERERSSGHEDFDCQRVPQRRELLV